MAIFCALGDRAADERADQRNSPEQRCSYHMESVRPCSEEGEYPAKFYGTYARAEVSKTTIVSTVTRFNSYERPEHV